MKSPPGGNEMALDKSTDRTMRGAQISACDHFQNSCPEARRQFWQSGPSDLSAPARLPGKRKSVEFML
ncbi:hypothetical protein ACAX43_26355 [Paraburkholderia sp. IW21]|uniref:hypothetical protein n=1 Tax=Paraburkholderia sp. IW21 TaxID=3242488 RepID=UPI003521CA9C